WKWKKLLKKSPIYYCNSNLSLHPDSLKIVLPNWKTGEKVLLKSSFIPVKNAIDVFTASYTDTLLIN
ncbi:hypothetical protein, partial [Sphingobacterium multivorum]